MKRNHSPRKPFTPGKRPQQTLEQFMTATVASIRNVYLVPVRITIAVRVAGNPEAELVVCDDDIDGVIDMLKRRRDAVVASQARAAEVLDAKSPPADGPRNGGGGGGRVDAIESDEAA